jgi:glycosyltransferase involved in cell wall biosynthesis
LVAYKRIDTAVRLFSKNGRRLKIVGDGPEYGALRHMARKNVEFCGRVSDQELRELYARARALLMPGEEDFGMTPVEALASGKPVIALGRGGVLESVPLGDPLGGVFYREPVEQELEAAIQKIERLESDIAPLKLQEWASRFCEKTFVEQMRSILFAMPGTSVALM